MSVRSFLTFSYYSVSENWKVTLLILSRMKILEMLQLWQSSLRKWENIWSKSKNWNFTFLFRADLASKIDQKNIVSEMRGGQPLLIFQFVVLVRTTNWKIDNASNFVIVEIFFLYFFSAGPFKGLKGTRC